MTLLLKQIFAFLKLLNSDTGTRELALGLALGMVLGFSPFLSLQTFVVIFLCFFLRIQLGAAFLSAFFFKLMAYLIDPVADQLGRAVLESDSLRSVFVEMYNLPIVPWTRFNNSIVMGSGLIGFILVIPGYFLFKVAIVKYRQKILSKFEKTKFWKAVKATAFYKWYATYNNLYG